MTPDVVVAPEQGVVPGHGAAPAALLRVTVSGGDRHADLAVPGGLPLAEVLPDLARAVGLLDADVAPAGYRLVASDGRVLRPGRSLAEHGVTDGARLAVAAAADDPAARVHDDPVAALADAVARDLDPWTTAATRRTTSITVALLLAGGPGALLLAGRGLATGVAAVTATVLLVAAGVWLSARSAAPPPYAVALVLAAAPYAACAGLLLAVPSHTAGVPLAAAGLAAATVGGLAAALPGGRPLGLGVLGAGAAVGAVGVVRTWVPDVLVVAPVLLTAVALAGSTIPWLAAGPACDVTDPHGATRRVHRAHDWLVAVSVSTGILLVLLTPAVVSRGGAGVALAVAGSAAVLLRTRRRRVASDVLAGIVAGGAGLLATAGSVAVVLPGWRPAVAVVLPLAGLALLAGTVVQVGTPVRRARLADLAESAVLLALLPLMVVAVGLLDRVAG